MKEQEIITCLKEKTENAAELLLQQYRPLIRYVVVPFLQNEQDADECVNDVAMKICEKIDSFDPEKGSWNAWITAISRNSALNKVRSYKSDGNAAVSINDEEAGEIPSSEPTPEEALIRKERQQLLAKAVKELPGQDQVLFYRKYYYQQSTLQIASELGMTERAVEGKLYRIKKRLRDRLGGDFNDR